jgi:two-component sensor histidine kinase
LENSSYELNSGLPKPYFMAGKVVFSLTFLFLSIVISSQSIPETLQSIDEIKNPRTRITKLDSLAEEMSLQSDSLNAEYFLAYGIAYGMYGLADSAKFYFEKVIPFTEATGHHYQLARAYNGIANVQRRSGESQESLENFFRAMDIVKNKEDTASIRFIASIYSNLSGIYFNLKQYDKARQYTEQSIKLAEQLNDGDQLAYANVGLALILDNQGDLKGAVEAHQRAEKYITEFRIEYLKGFNKLNLAEIYERQNNLSEAERLYQELIDDEKMSVEVLLSGYANLARIKVENDSPKEGIRLANELLRLASQRNAISPVKDAHEILFLAYEKIGNYKMSLSEHKEFMHYKDSIINMESINAINEVEKRYETELKERQIETLAFENEQNQLLLDKQASEKQLYILAIITLLIILGFGIRQVVQKNKFNQILTAKNATISNALSEREVLLREIHHRVKNNLQIISSLLNLQSRFIKDQNAVDAVQEGRNRVKSMALIHQKLYQQDNIEGIYMPEYIDNLSASLVTSYKVSGGRIQIDKQVDKINLDIDTAIPVGLILNELLTNSLKYAFIDGRIGNLIIKLQVQNQQLVLEVSDNGIGMDASSSVNKNSFGLTLIESLAEKLDAKTEILQKEGTHHVIRMTNYKMA